jgi:hypothetical protein
MAHSLTVANVVNALVALNLVDLDGDVPWPGEPEGVKVVMRSDRITESPNHRTSRRNRYDEVQFRETLAQSSYCQSALDRATASWNKI